MRTAYLLALIVMAPAVASAQQPCTSDADSTVDAIYRQILERPARSDGNAQAERLRSGQTTVREIAREVAKSPEHRERFLAINRPADRVNAVTALYRHLLDRDPDAPGLASHVEALSQGADIHEVIDSVIDSPEYLRKFGTNSVPGATLRYCADGQGESASNDGNRNMRFRNMDRNGNGAIERDEWRGNRASFEAQDWNNDGVLSGDEVRPGARRAVRRGADFDPAGPSTWTDEAFRDLDRDGNNRITSNEWYHGGDYFRRADRNRDGVLTRAEFTDASDDRDNRFDVLDVNNNGRIERSEWHGSFDAFEWLDRNNDNVLSRAEVVGSESDPFGR